VRSFLPQLPPATLGAVAALILASHLPSQTKQTGPTLERAVAPKYAGTFHPTLGLIKEEEDYSRAIGTYLVVNNHQLTNYYGVCGKDQEWVDNNVIESRGSSGVEQVNGLSFAYCSTDSNPNGVSETIHIYDDSVYCAGPRNWPVANCSYHLQGLPGGNNGSTACWIVSVDLLGVECDLITGFGRSMGWGQVWDNGDTGPWVASGGNGQTDSWTWWDRTVPNSNAFQGCYWFGGLWNGFSMQMWAGPADTYRYWAEDLGGVSTALDNCQLQVDLAVKKDEVVTFSVTHPQGLAIDQMVLLYSTSQVGAPFSYLGGNVLVDPTNHNRTPPLPSTASLQIPASTTDAYTQAACFFQGSFVGFTNGLHHINL
jgi:hypothetical protein